MTGETQLTWSFAGQDFAPGDTATVRFDTTVTTAATAGSHSGGNMQAAYLEDAEGGFSDDAGVEQDPYDLDGDGDTTDLVMVAVADWTVLAESQAVIQKLVKGSAGDGEWKQEDASIAALESNDTTETDGSDVDYRIQVTNPGTTPLQNIVAYDILPYVGDAGVGSDLADESRGSEFAVNFSELLGTLPNGVSVQYSVSSNPSRPELGVTTGDGTWSDTLPDDPTTVRALRFVVAGPLAAGEEIDIDWRGTLPVFTWGQSEELCQATVAKKAWNSVAFRADRVYGDDVRSLLPAEAPKVSIRQICGQVGDYARYDVNRNGLQDADEKPAPGVTFQLMNGDGTPVLDEDGNPITTVTDAEGKYFFDVPVGDWRVQVIQLPDNTALTVANAGGDDTIDSDAPTLDEPTDAVTITAQDPKNETLDAGLVGVVSVGDFVWSDTNQDGIQDAGEPGIEGVELTLTGPDGQPVTDVNGDTVGSVTTDENGAYTFDDLPALRAGQTYTVSVAQTPDGNVPTLAGQGGDRAKDSSTGSASSEGLTDPGARDATLDFGFIPLVSVGDFVWSDTNRNGIQDIGDPGIEGVELTLVGPDGGPVVDMDGNEVPPVTTDASGHYSFDGLRVLPEGRHYTVKVSGPTGYLPTKANVGDDRATDSSTGSAESTDLTEPGQRDATLDFGFIPAVSVGDFVWYDVNHNGLQDAGEPGIEGVELTLAGPEDGPVTDVNGDPVGPVATDADGAYSFDGLPALMDGESYTVTVSDVPSGYAPTLANQGDARAKDSSTGSASSEGLTAPGERDSTLDFGFIGEVSVGDFVWYDANRNGLQDEGEKGIAGVEVVLTGPDGLPVTDVHGDLVAPVTADADGAYSFIDLPVLAKGQSYTVSVPQTPEGYAPTLPGQGDDRAKDSATGSASSEGLTAPADRDATLDFGFVGIVSVGDFVWSDMNRNGLQDVDEPGIEGVELTLTGPDGQPVLDASGNAVGPVTTDGNGVYSFDDLPALAEGQSYTVSVTQVSMGYAPTKAHQGDNRAEDSSTGSASSEGLTAPGERDSTLDFGFVPVVSVGDFVWFDTNGNGLQEAGEPGIPDIVLSVYGPDGSIAQDVEGNDVGSAKTDVDGHYLFGDLPVLQDGQSYTVKIDRDATLAINPEFSRFAPTAAHAGARDVDSDTSEASSEGLTGPGEADLTLDFGFIATEPVIDVKKLDTNGNDADTVDESAPLPDGTASLVFVVTNFGAEDLVDIRVGDETISGSGTVSALTGTLEDGTVVGPEWTGPLAPGAKITYTATLTGVVADEPHLDRVTVDAKGRWSDTPVSDRDDYNAHTPRPAISIVKRDAAGNDANSVADTVRIDGGSQDLVFVITNTGDEAFRDVAVSDKIVRGAAALEDLVCAFPDGSVGLKYGGVLSPGASFECTASVTGLVAGDQHTDMAAVSGTGVVTGVGVSDDDPYNVIRSSGLAITGGMLPVAAIVSAVLLVVGGGSLLLIRRRRNGDSDTPSV